MENTSVRVREKGCAGAGAVWRTWLNNVLERKSAPEKGRRRVGDSG